MLAFVCILSACIPPTANPQETPVAPVAAPEQEMWEFNVDEPSMEFALAVMQEGWDAPILRITDNQVDGQQFQATLGNPAEECVAGAFLNWSGDDWTGGTYFRIPLTYEEEQGNVGRSPGLAQTASSKKLRDHLSGLNSMVSGRVSGYVVFALYPGQDGKRDHHYPGDTS